MDYGDQYLTYKEYVKLGGTVEQAPFNLLEFEARKRIDEKTLNRLINIDDIPDEVKICMFKIIELMTTYNNKLDKIMNNNVASENTDGYSVTYLKSDETVEIINQKNNQIDNTITTYLNGVIIDGVNILYLGVC